MQNYKADITLNEKDSLQDMLTLEKSVVKLYSTAITEGVSDGFRSVVKENWQESVADQLEVFLQMTEHGYYTVESAPQETLDEQREKFNEVKSQLS